MNARPPDGYLFAVCLTVAGSFASLLTTTAPMDYAGLLFGLWLMLLAILLWLVGMTYAKPPTKKGEKK